LSEENKLANDKIVKDMKKKATKDKNVDNWTFIQP